MKRRVSMFAVASIVVSHAFSGAYAAVGEYKEVPCKETYFQTNNCQQCFDGGTTQVGQKIESLFDNWNNANSNEQVAYKDEQTMPKIINLGGEGTNWIQTPQDAQAFWKYSTDVVWTQSNTGTSRQEFVLEGGKSVRFMESNFGAFYSLEKTTKAPGEKIGMLAFDVNYHALDNDGNEQDKKMHRECVAFGLGEEKKEVVTPKPVEPKPQPKQMTKVKTGPEAELMVVLALALGVTALYVRRRHAS